MMMLMMMVMIIMPCLQLFEKDGMAWLIKKIISNYLLIVISE